MRATFDRLMERKKTERGAALLTVLIAMMVISLILFEFQYNSMVERKLAYNDLNQTQAYYLAKSGARLGVLRVALYGRLRRSPQLKSLTQSIGDITPFLEKVWQIPVPPFPPETGTITKMIKSDRDAAEKSLAQTKIKEGKYSHVIKTEASKINLNYLILPKDALNQPINFRDPPKALHEYVAQMLINVLEGFIRESERPYDEYPDLRPEEMVMDIMDWVNPGEGRLAGGAKDTYYEQQKPSYKAKRNRFYTVEELRLVRGMNEKLFAKLKPHITVYSYDGRINLNSASKTVLRSLYRDFTEDDVNRIIEERDRLDGGFMTEKAFVDFVTTNLGRTGFSTVYSDPKNYPFTVGSQAFLIESLGMVEKSKSSVQRVIRVAVALTDGRKRGGEPVPDINDPVKCNGTAGLFWDKRDNKCKRKPTKASECQFIGATWMADPSGREGCKINNEPMMYPDNSTSTKREEPNAVKILYWSEA